MRRALSFSRSRKFAASRPALTLLANKGAVRLRSNQAPKRTSTRERASSSPAAIKSAPKTPPVMITSVAWLSLVSTRSNN